MTKLGLSALYESAEDDRYRRVVRRMMALAFLQTDIVAHSFEEEIVDGCPINMIMELNPLFDYFRRQWLPANQVSLN
jgi:hypothetical protein